MPTINIFYTTDEHATQCEAATKELKEFAARELTCGDIRLQPNEISVRLIKTIGAGMLGTLEVEITAHAFGERINQQDEICLRFREFLKTKTTANDIRVWLLLPQLGHSWE